MPNHYQNQCWLTLSLTFNYKHLLNLNRNKSVTRKRSWICGILDVLIKRCTLPSGEFVKTRLCLPTANSRFVYCKCKCDDDVIKRKHFPRNCPFVRGNHRSPVNFFKKGKWRGALMYSLICAWINGWVNNQEVCDLRRHRAHYDVMLMKTIVNAVENNIWCAYFLLYNWFCMRKIH